MERGMNKIIVVTRKTRLQELVSRYNTVEQAKFYIEHMGADFSDYIKENDTYHTVRRQIIEISEKFARVQEIDRNFLPTMIFGENDIVVAVGQDGMVANVMKYLNKQPLIGINPDRNRWDGVLLPFEAKQLTDILPKVISGKYNAKEITMAQATTQDGRQILAVNDLFIGCKTHTSARYDITWNNAHENQSSSGIIVSTGLGATGWYKSVITQMQKIATAFNCGQIVDKPLNWDDNQLTFVVREPYPSCSTQADIVFGKIDRNDKFKIVSKMPVNGVVFSDGIEEDSIIFNSGMEIVVEIADKKGIIVV